jgi:hypothetical protein
MKKFLLGGTISLVAPFMLKAQQKPVADTVLKGTTIEVIQSYKPEVRQVPKPVFTPEMPPKDTSKLRLQYTVPQQTLYYTYSSLPLRPLALGKDTTKLPYPNYVKLGAGNFRTFLADAGIVIHPTQKLNAGIHLRHLSQNGNLENQKLSETSIYCDGNYRTEENTFHGSAEIFRNRYHYYGYDQRLYEFPEDSVRQTFTGLHLGFDFKNEKSNQYGINYHPAGAVSVYGDDYQARESSFKFDLPATKDLDTSLQLGFGINGAFTRLKTEFRTTENNVFQLTPSLKFHRQNFDGTFGLYPTFSSVGPAYLLPEIKIGLQLGNTGVHISAGWIGKLKRNTYEELSSYNPYMLNEYIIKHTRADEVFGGVQTSFGNHLSFSGKLSWWQFKNLPMFINFPDRKTLFVAYSDKANALSVEGTLKYIIGKEFGVWVTATIINYYNSTISRIYHEPGLRLKGDLNWKPFDKFSVSAYGIILEQNFALNDQNAEIKLDGVFDIGGTAEYNFIPRLSAFLTLNNLLNNRYQRWYGYETLGINVIGGLRLKF